MKLLLATRGSPLALWQAETTRALLARTGSGHEAELYLVQSTGDQDAHSDLAQKGGTGLFTAEIDAAVLSGRAHAGVHSLKDLPTSVTPGLVLAAVLARGPAEDALVARRGQRLDELPRGARVATGSVRRVAMLKRARPDLEVVGMRGNVDTRLAKLHAGAADAIVLARAGLERLGLAQHVSEVLGPPRFLPAVGQGIVGLTCRAQDEATRSLLHAIGDGATWSEAQAERMLLALLHAGCNAPLGARAQVRGDELEIEAVVLARDGQEALEERVRGPLGRGAELAQDIAQRLVARGARRLIDAARGA